MDKAITRRRSHLEVIAGIIRACPNSPTHVMYGANISFEQFQTYTNCLTEAGLLKELPVARDRKFYEATPIGLEFVSRLDHALELLNGYVKVQPDGTR